MKTGNLAIIAAGLLVTAFAGCTVTVPSKGKSFFSDKSDRMYAKIVEKDPSAAREFSDQFQSAKMSLIGQQMAAQSMSEEDYVASIKNRLARGDQPYACQSLANISARVEKANSLAAAAGVTERLDLSDLGTDVKKFEHLKHLNLCN